MQFGQILRRLGDVSRLIALAAERVGSEPRSVCFHQSAIERHARGNIAQRLCLGVRQIAGEGDQESEIERAPGLLPTSAETMHYAAEAGRGPVFLEDFKEVIPRVGGTVFGAAMDEDRTFASRRNQELTDKPFLLNGMSRAFMVIIEADLAAGNHFGLGEQVVEFLQGGIVCFDRFVP